MAVLLAAISAVLWGTGDFLGGTAARRSAPLPATLTSSAVGLVVVLGGSLVLGGSPAAADLMLGAGSGVFVALALLSFYRSMAVGKMAVVAPVSSVASAGVPLIVGVWGGDQLSGMAWVAVVAGLIGIALASVEADDGAEHGEVARPGEAGGRGGIRRRAGTSRVAAGVVPAVLAGVGFGAYLSLIAHTDEGAGLWPLLASRVTSLLTLSVLAAARGQLRSAAPATGQAALAGLFDGLGNSFYLLASQRGQLAVVGTIGSMYPASTVGLAALVNHERPRAHQVLGILLLFACVAILGSS